MAFSSASLAFGLGDARLSGRRRNKNRRAEPRAELIERLRIGGESLTVEQDLQKTPPVRRAGLELGGDQLLHDLGLGEGRSQVFSLMKFV